MDRGAWRAYSPWGGQEVDTTERLTQNHESILQIPDFPLIFFIFYLKEDFYLKEATSCPW